MPWSTSCRITTTTSLKPTCPSDLYIDKELSINERIEQERFSAVASLVSRPDCVIVSSVSCIYGLNPPETFLEHHLRVHVGGAIEPQD